LDLLRFLAFLLVFAHHAISDFFPNHSILTDIGKACGSGLQLFFLLSSYLITELLLQEREKTGSIHLRAFFIRRALRIWPLYFCFIGLSLLISKTTHFTIFTTRQFLFYLLLAGNWWTVFHSFIPTVIGPLWSISVEEQYYIVWPLIGRTGARRGLWAACILFLILSTATLIFLGHSFAPRYAVWANSFVEFQYFAVGAILALILHNRTLSLPTHLRPVLLIVACVLLYIAQWRFHIVSDRGVGATALVLGYGLFTFGVILLFLGFLQARVPEAAKPFIYLGKISYGLYVFHDLSIRLIDRAAIRYSGDVFATLKCFAALAVSMVLAMLSYRFLELPFLHLKKRFTFIPSRVD